MCSGVLVRLGSSVSKEKYFVKEVLASEVWLYLNNCCKVAVACLYQERGNWNNVLSPIWWAYDWVVL